MTSSSESITVAPAPQDSAWPPAHIWETMSAPDLASWLAQIQRDRARRLELDIAETDLRRRRPHGDLRNDEDNQEENREPPSEVKPLIDMFPGVSAALLTRVFERKLKATELIRFKEKSVTDLDQEDRVFKMTESGGTVGFKKAASSLKDWGPNPQMWTACFLTYLAVIGYLFGDKYPKAVPNLLMFMGQILDFAQTYHWSEAVLPLALRYAIAINDHELKRKYDDLESELMAYQKLVELLRSREHNEANLILELIRQTTDVHEVLRQVEHGDMLCDLALVPETRYRYAFPFRQTLPDFLQSRDNPYLHSPIYEWSTGGDAQPLLNIASSGFDSSQPPAPFLRPYHAAEVMVPGLDSVELSRWTSVFSDNALMRKILRAYFLHDYEWFTFFHKDYFFKDMAAGKRRFSSPLLVNALFALATYCYRELPFRVEYWNPHTLGYKFLAEARRLWEVEEAGPTNRLTTLQAGLLLNVVYDMMGADRIGWKYTLRAVAIANSFNLFDASDRTRSKKLQHARDFTAWALFSWQSQRSYHFSRPPIITSPPTVPLPDPTQRLQWYGEVWVKYPQNPCIFSSNFGHFFKAKAEFLIILNEISLQCFRAVEPQGAMTEQNLSAFESRLENCYNGLPECLSPTKIALPAHLKLHMHYYFVLINIHRPIPGRMHPKPPLFSSTGDCDESKKQDVFIDAFIRFETLFLIYYLRHGFDRLDILLLPYLVFEAFTNLNHVKKCANPSHLNSLQSTLLLAAKGLREQGRIYFLAKTMFQLVYRDMRPEEMELFGRFVTLGEEACQPEIRTDFIHSDWPVKVLGFGDDSENKSLDELIKEYDDLSCGST